MLAMMGLLARNGTATGQVLHHGRNLLGLPPPSSTPCAATASR
jgi:hypothetical protein